MNYFHINRPSNLITAVVSSSKTPTDTTVDLFIQAPPRALDSYYAACQRNPDHLLDIGELMAKSGFVYDQVVSLSPVVMYGYDRKAMNCQSRQPVNQPVYDRNAAIQSWLELHPFINKHDLSDKFGLGVVVAQAYIDRFTSLG